MSQCQKLVTLSITKTIGSKYKICTVYEYLHISFLSSLWWFSGYEIFDPGVVLRLH